MGRMAVIVISSILAVSAVAQSGGPRGYGSEFDREHTEWIADALHSMKAVKVGMTRADLEKVFTTEGGFSGPSWRTYVYRKCPYIKVDVKFAAASRVKELPTDKVVEISRPYLEWAIMD